MIVAIQKDLAGFIQTVRRIRLSRGSNVKLQQFCLAMLVLHDDATREYAYGPAQGLPDTKVGTFTRRSMMKQKRKTGR
jgi:hypothetical protein